MTETIETVRLQLRMAREREAMAQEVARRAIEEKNAAVAELEKLKEEVRR